MRKDEFWGGNRYIWYLIILFIYLFIATCIYLQLIVWSQNVSIRHYSKKRNKTGKLHLARAFFSLWSDETISLIELAKFE